MMRMLLVPEARLQVLKMEMPRILIGRKENAPSLIKAMSDMCKQSMADQQGGEVDYGIMKQALAMLVNKLSTSRRRDTIKAREEVVKLDDQEKVANNRTYKLMKICTMKLER
mmetsp:Transcript_26532/g.56071  ORF Transcript_26532/g.56071 Transcript_26532/m.56071 type:complete len:112 (+) Transcript_26532:329-664(+)